ncbi:MAG: hypothetical protein OXG97_21855 [Candidatus Poribacteria bacterium]|nr:hypothetical protein [Candidatus Poribacteria bacterium]
MKVLLFSCITCLAIAAPALGELTPQDLDKIRLIVNEEVKKESADTKAELKEYIDLKIANVETQIRSLENRFEARFSSIDERFKGIDERFKGIDDKFKNVQTQMTLTINLIYALIALIVAAIAIPQIIMAWRGRIDTTHDKNMEELARKISEQAEEIEMLKQQRIVKS